MGIDLHNLGLLAHAHDLGASFTRTHRHRPAGGLRRSARARAASPPARSAAAERAGARGRRAALLRAAAAAVARRRAGRFGRCLGVRERDAPARHEPAAAGDRAWRAPATTRCSTSAASSTCSTSRRRGATASTCAASAATSSIRCRRTTSPATASTSSRPSCSSTSTRSENGFDLRGLWFALKADPKHWWQVADPAVVKRRVTLRNAHEVYLLVIAQQARASPGRCRRRSSPTTRRASG